MPAVDADVPRFLLDFGRHDKKVPTSSRWRHPSIHQGILDKNGALDASQIEEAADGRRRGTRRQAWRAVKGKPQRGVSPDGGLNERTAIGRLREDKTQRIAAQKGGLVRCLPPSEYSWPRSLAPPYDSLGDK